MVPGSYPIDETVLAGWDLTNIAISGDSDGGSVTTASGATVDLDPGENIVVTFSNRKRGSITVVKETDPAGDTAVFSFASPGLAPPSFSLSDGGSLPFTDLVPGSYAVDETVLAGWDLTNITISGDTDGGSTTTATGATVDLDPGENITVTFSNRKRGSITVVKETNPAGDPAVFSFISPGLAPPAFTLSDGGSLPFTDLVPGSYTVDELALAGWDLTNITISGDTDGGSTTTATGATVDLDPGENITVTFSNRKRGSITVVKETDPAGDPAVFSFASPGLAPPAFTLSDGGSLPFTDLLPGSYSVGELALAGWDLTNITISGDTDGGSTTTATGATVDLDPGENITVTFTNRKRGSITVIKETDPAGDPAVFSFASPGLAPPSFTLSDGGSLPFTDLVPGGYSVDELALAGWDLVDITITGDTDGGSTTTATGATVDLDPGESITVTFHNRKPGSITIVKEADPEDGTVFFFNYFFNGQPVGQFPVVTGSSQSFNNLSTGTHTIDEVTLADWTLTDVTITGDSDNASTTTADSAVVDLDPGEHITVTFSNTRLFPCGDCDGKVTRLTLRYLGSEANVQIQVFQRKGAKVFDGVVQPGERFTFLGVDKKGTLGPEISIFVNGGINAKFHTSCSQPIGPGLVAGDFVVVTGFSRNGGRLCPIDTPPSSPQCDCDGKVTQLTLEYLGSEANAQIQVFQKKGTKVFDGVLQPGEQFTFLGVDKKGTLGPEISIWVNGGLNAKIHTSCSQPVGPGLVAGDFVVVEGFSRNGGPLCPLN